jgi:hypothetical protein
MTTAGYGAMRATDADRENVRTILADAHADGRLTWEEFDSRSTTLMTAQTYDELAALTADLAMPVPYKAYQGPLVPRVRTNQTAVMSLAFGVGQVLLPFVGAIVAIVCGHAARSQIRQTGEGGAGLALSGLVLGYLGVLIPLLAVLTVIGLAIWA